MWGAARVGGVVAVALIMVAGCLDGGGTGPPDDASPYLPSRDGISFSAVVDNPYLPLVPGSRWVYAEQGAHAETVVITVSGETRVVDGVTCIVVRDEVAIDGKVVELTFDWYAQDEDGNVWYFGEDSRTMRDGAIVNHKGSWEAGVDGAQAGLIMPAVPEIGVTYRQEYRKGVAEDLGKVIDLGRSTTVPFGAFEDLLVTEDWNPIESVSAEHKFYAAGIGLVLERQVSGGAELQLVSFEPGAG